MSSLEFTFWSDALHELNQELQKVWNFIIADACFLEILNNVSWDETWEVYSSTTIQQ